MGKMDDFDLDLRKITENGNSANVLSASDMITSEIISKVTETITRTFKGQCVSVETPTTGMTSACCKKGGTDVEPQCVP